MIREERIFTVPIGRKGVCGVNIAYFLLPKGEIAYLYDDCTFRQGLEKMRNRGYTAIPVITRDGRYVGTVSEGDFLWRILDSGQLQDGCSMRDLEKLEVRDILGSKYPPVRITATMDELLDSAMQQNFVPVIDDLDNLIGIITRRSIMSYLKEEKNFPVHTSHPEELSSLCQTV